MCWWKASVKVQNYTSTLVYYLLFAKIIIFTLRNNGMAKTGLAGSAEPPLEDGNELQIQAE